MADYGANKQFRNENANRLAEAKTSPKIRPSEGSPGLEGSSFQRSRRGHKNSMISTNHKSALSQSRFSSNHSLSALGSLGGRNRSLHDIKTQSRLNFDLKHTCTMNEIEASVKKCEKLRQAAEDEYDGSQKLRLLNRENKILHNNVKKVNEYLSTFLVHVKEYKEKTHSSMSFKYGSQGKLKKTRDQKLKFQDQENHNYSKMLKNLSEEHQKTKNRVFQVQDPRYILNLKREVRETKEKIKEMTAQNLNLKTEEFGTNRKLHQVINQGKPDAMNKISQLLKDLITLEERKTNYDKQIDFQLRTEIDLDQEIENSKTRAKEMQEKAKQEGLFDHKDDINSLLYSPERVKTMKQKIEKHSLNAIHRKFYTKIFKQKEKLQRILDSYNDSVIAHNNVLSNDAHSSATLNTSKESSINKSQDLIQMGKHPLLQQINSSLTSLKKSLPRITNKLKWDKPIWFNKNKLNSLKNTGKNKRSLHSEDSRHQQNTRNSTINNEYDDASQLDRSIGNKVKVR
ncbi:unnamed protein product [Moneuplotes crassus]|uniref:Uncharacterized protein n=1 Tax=Euplotes crassus TaxID=5936 RepID=A0AAD1X3U3_EUPCR|nr:unnamed protein product [Moneuplotes crassus]